MAFLPFRAFYLWYTNHYLGTQREQRLDGSQSGTGLQHSKLTVEILERVLGEPVMTAVLATKEAEVRVPTTSELHPPYNINGMTDALRELVGTETSSGRLQVRTRPHVGGWAACGVMMWNRGVRYWD